MRRPGLHAGVILVSICLLWGGLAAGAVLGTGVFPGEDDISPAETDDQRPGLGGAPGPAQQAENATANDTDRHRNPDEYGEDGDSDRVSSWLTNRLAERLGDSVLQLSEGQYDFARQFVGDTFDDRLGQLVEVDKETDDDESETTETLNETQDEQEEFIDSVEEYNETRAEYQQALEAGETERARTLARELVALAAEIETRSLRLEELLTEIAAIADVDLSEPLATLEALRTEITTEAAALREEVFVDTTLTVDANRTSISFLDPLGVTGRLQTAAGDPIANETIQLQIGAQTITTETNATGQFTSSYRPINVSAAAESLTVTYQPAPESIYFGSTATVPIEITQVTPTFANVTVPAALAFGDTGPISGTVQVDGIPVDTAPIRVTLAGEPFGTASVTNGAFETTVTVPAEIPAGEQQVQLSLPANGTAIAGTTATAPIQISETDTALAVNATELDASTIQVRGELTTVDEQAVPAQPVVMRVDGVAVETVTTAADGGFMTAVSLPEPTAEAVTVQVVYEAVETNLEASEATTELSLSVLPTTGTDDTGGDGNIIQQTIDELSEVIQQTIDEASESLPRTVIAAVAGVGFFLIILWGVGRVTDRTPLAAVPVIRRFYRETTGHSGDSNAAESPAQSSAPAEQDPDTIEALLTYADEQLRAGQPDAAVNASYAAVRAALADRLNVSRELTHWEFYHTYRTTIAEDEPCDATTPVERLRAITDAYERATFSQQTTPTETAQLALDQAYRLLDIDQPASGADTTASTDD